MNDYMTPEQVAELFGTSRTWVLRRCKTGEFPHLRIGSVIRFKPQHIAQIEKAHERAAAPATADEQWGRATRGSRSRAAVGSGT